MGNGRRPRGEGRTGGRSSSRSRTNRRGNGGGGGGEGGGRHSRRGSSSSRRYRGGRSSSPPSHSTEYSKDTDTFISANDTAIETYLDDADARDDDFSSVRRNRSGGGRRGSPRKRNKNNKKGRRSRGRGRNSRSWSDSDSDSDSDESFKFKEMFKDRAAELNDIAEKFVCKLGAGSDDDSSYSSSEEEDRRGRRRRRGRSRGGRRGGRGRGTSSSSHRSSDSSYYSDSDTKSERSRGRGGGGARRRRSTGGDAVLRKSNSDLVRHSTAGGRDFMEREALGSAASYDDSAFLLLERSATMGSSRKQAPTKSRGRSLSPSSRGRPANSPGGSPLYPNGRPLPPPIARRGQALSPTSARGRTSCPRGALSPPADIRLDGNRPLQARNGAALASAARSPGRRALSPPATVRGGLPAARRQHALSPGRAPKSPRGPPPEAGRRRRALSPDLHGASSFTRRGPASPRGGPASPISFGGAPPRPLPPVLKPGRHNRQKALDAQYRKISQRMAGPPGIVTTGPSLHAHGPVLTSIKQYRPKTGHL